MANYRIKSFSLSHRLCIPIKTVEHWKYGDRECPPYMKPVILQAFNIRYLPENVFVGGDLAPEKEKSYSDKKQMAKKQPSNLKNTENNTEKIINENKDNTDTDADFLKMINNRSWSLRDFEQTHIKHGDVKTNSVLSSTNYLDEILKKRKK